ncbi:MAG: PIN domain-containing protein [Akkermansiaceae bacterium]
MVTQPFIDTNILFYAGSNAAADASKKRIASALVAELDFCLSSQVVQEYLSNALGKKALGITTTQIEALLENLRDVTVQPVSYPLILEAWKLRNAYRISHWDATIIAAAQSLGCEILYSEDMSDGQNYGGVRVVNPFK